VSSLHLRRGIFTFIQSSLYRTAILSILIQTLFPVPSADGLSLHPSTHIFVSTSLNIDSHVPAGLSESLSAVVMDRLLGFPELDFEAHLLKHVVWTKAQTCQGDEDCIRRSRSCIFGTGGMPSTFPQIAFHSYDDSLRVSDTSIQLLVLSIDTFINTCEWAVFLS
ncbi:hypothetical protein EDC04DRAFT_2626998, partial [Pisolithus marmoratus]